MILILSVLGDKSREFFEKKITDIHILQSMFAEIAEYSVSLFNGKLLPISVSHSSNNFILKHSTFDLPIDLYSTTPISVLLAGLHYLRWPS
jgi:hypothetical protein